MESIRIRDVEERDVNDIVRIYSEIIRNKVSVLFKKSIKKQVSSKNELVTCYVADDGKNVLGFMIGHILVPGFGIEKSAWIAALGVDPKYMGRDIGKLLAYKLFAFYKSMGINKIHTSVLWDAVDVLSFFKAIGFDRSRFVDLQKNID